MKVSHKWLQTYFKKPLPSSDEIAKLLTFHVFEVEGIEKKAHDDVLDVKVLPDRASYCLSHEGIARELSALLSDNHFIPREIPSIDVSPDVPDIQTSISADSVCDRHVELPILDLSVHVSPQWLVNYLETVGQRSINFIVDLTNFVMLDIGQPMHVFDSERLEGDITVRCAKGGEKISLLGGRDLELDSSIVVLADSVAALDVAGIKGGKKAEMTSSTKHAVVVASHFDPSSIRKTSGKLSIKTDASKRFENGISSKYPEIAMRYFAALLRKEDSDALFGKMVSVGSGDVPERKIEVRPSFIAEKLGKNISVDEMILCLTRGSIPARREGDLIAIYPPHYRNDLNIVEDIVDEVGRLYGYENIEPKLPVISTPTDANNALSYRNRVRNFLMERGFSEIYSYTLKDKGEVEIVNPLAEDKKFYRSNLQDAMAEKLSQNIYYADLLGLSKIKLFEFGRVWKSGREYMALSIGVAYKKAAKGERVNDEIKTIRDELFIELGSKVEILCTVDDSGGILSKDGKQIGVTNNLDGIMEVDFDTLITGLPIYEKDVDVNLPEQDFAYKPLSPYPFIVRDIALFTPPGKSSEEVFEIIRRNVGELLVRHELFDVFEKKSKETGEIEKISYAFRLVFQSYEKTLTDEEINKVMDKVSDALRGQSFEVR